LKTAEAFPYCFRAAAEKVRLRAEAPPKTFLAFCPNNPPEEPAIENPIVAPNFRKFREHKQSTRLLRISAG
jgi:hypothetical protein